MEEAVLIDSEMTLYDFIRLDLNARMEEVNQRGEFVTNDPEFYSNFYAVGDFFAEVVIDQDAGIVEVSPFKEGDRYDRMVERISLERIAQ